MNRCVVSAVAFCLLSLSPAVGAQILPPPPYIMTWDPVVGVSPKNSVVPDPYRYAFHGNMRLGDGTPIANFPAAQLELDFGLCHEPSTRPADQIPADRDSDEQGNVIWSLYLNFGGADPCSVRVLIQNVVFAILHPHQALPDPAMDGGIRSPDENGDGRIDLRDLAIFQREFFNAEQREDWRGDLGPQFDGLTALNDLSSFQVHFTAP